MNCRLLQLFELFIAFILPSMQRVNKFINISLLNLKQAIGTLKTVFLLIYLQ